MSLRLRLAAGTLALLLIGDEEADKLQTLNNLLGNRSRESGVKPMRGLDRDGKVSGSIETEGRASARPRTCSHLRHLRCAKEACLSATFVAGRINIKPRTPDPLLFPEQSIG
jgi:hypothetical protein